MDRKGIGTKLRELRGERSVAEVADSVGISLSALRMYESGNRVPRDEIKIRLANYFGKGVSEIFF